MALFGKEQTLLKVGKFLVSIETIPNSRTRWLTKSSGETFLGDYEKKSNRKQFRRKAGSSMLLKNYVVTSLACLVMSSSFLVLAGCGNAQAPTPTGINVDVSVTKGGEPLGNVEVNFVPIDGDTQSAIYAQADGAGHAVITDAQPIEYKVCLSKMDAGGPDAEFEILYGTMSPFRADVTKQTSFSFDLE